MTKKEFKAIAACKNCLKSKTICHTELRRRRKTTGKCLFGAWDYDGKQYTQDNMYKMMEEE